MEIKECLKIARELRPDDKVEVGFAVFETLLNTAHRGREE
jgi:hypothetical protein